MRHHTRALRISQVHRRVAHFTAIALAVAAMTSTALVSDPDEGDHHADPSRWLADPQQTWG